MELNYKNYKKSCVLNICDKNNFINKYLEKIPNVKLNTIIKLNKYLEENKINKLYSADEFKNIILNLEL